MNRRTFSAAIAAFFGFGRVAKADDPYHKAERGYRMDPPGGMTPQEPYDAFCDKTITQLRKGIMVTLPLDATLDGFNP